jgi:hypothetical protein
MGIELTKNRINTYEFKSSQRNKALEVLAKAKQMEAEKIAKRKSDQQTA